MNVRHICCPGSKEDEMKTNVSAGLLRRDKIKPRRISASVLTRAALWAVLALAVSVASCKSSEGGETPQERAKREIVESLFLPPDSRLQEMKVMRDSDMLTIMYATNESLEKVEEFFTSKTRERGYSRVSESSSGISYRDESRRNITVMWFARDPDLYEFKTVFRVAVSPLPSELKEEPE
jgi:hypothetical protein